MSSSLSSDLSQDGSSKRKALLTRSNAMCGDDDTRLRPPDQIEQAAGGGTLGSRTKRYSTTSSVSKDSSYADYTDSTGIDLMQFIVNTLHKNAKDREMLLSLESEMRKFVLDKSRQAYKFPKMSSYNRMLVHRVAAFFGLDHNIDQSGTLVVVTKTANTRVPDLEFAKCIKNNLFTDRLMFRRNVQSFDECQMNNMYANFPAVQPNLAFGSSTAVPVVETSLPPSLDMVRRARSFEVGEWHNSMTPAGSVGSGSAALLPAGSTGVLPSAYLSSNTGAAALTGGGGGSSNSSSSWQLANTAGGVQFASSRPESIVSPTGSILIDPSCGVYYAHQSPQAQFIMTNNVQQQFQQQQQPAQASCSNQSAQARNGQCYTSDAGGDDASKYDGASAENAPPPPVTATVQPPATANYGPYVYGVPPAPEYAMMLGGGVSGSNVPPPSYVQHHGSVQQPMNAVTFYGRQQPPPNVPMFYVQPGADGGTVSAGGSDYASAQHHAAAALSYYYAPAVPGPYPIPGLPQQASMDEALVKQFQHSMHISPNAGVADGGNGAPQLIPYNTPAGVCYITVGGRPAAPAYATVPQQQQQLLEQQQVAEQQSAHTVIQQQQQQ